MAETRPTTTSSAGSSSSAVKATSVQPKRGGNAISYLAPVICIIVGYLIL